MLYYQLLFLILIDVLILIGDFASRFLPEILMVSALKNDCTGGTGPKGANPDSAVIRELNVKRKILLP